MKKIFIYRYVISFVLFLIGNITLASTYVSLSPVITEIIYSLGAENNLLAVSSTCNYPEKVKEKPIIGDTYFVNMEMIVSLQPDYLFAMTSAKPKLGELSLTKTKPVYFEFTNIEEIYSTINNIAKITNSEKNAQKLIKDIKQNIEGNKTNNPKKILYVVQTNPLVTIGSESYITDIIEKSGHISITSDIPYYYPNITLEYVLEKNPDVIIICFPSDVEKLKELFPKSRILYLSLKQRDIINRPGPRVAEAVKLFSKLNFSEEPTH